MKFLCECGCTWTRQNLAVLRANKINGMLPGSKRLCCPEHKHKGFICGREIICDNCKETFRVSTTQGSTPTLCPVCSEDTNRVYHKTYYAKNKIKVKKKPNLTEEEQLWKPSPTQFKKFQNSNKDAGWDCKHRDMCLKVYDKFKCMPCGACEFYTPVPIKHLYKPRDEVLWDMYAPVFDILDFVYV